MKRRLCRHEALACARMKRSAPVLLRVPIGTLHRAKALLHFSCTAGALHSKNDQSVVPCAYFASRILAPMDVPLLPIWFEIMLSRCSFKAYTRLMINTEKSIDCSASLSFGISVPPSELSITKVKSSVNEAFASQTWSGGFAAMKHSRRHSCRNARMKRSAH